MQISTAMHLIHDEEELFNSKQGLSQTYRVRVWAAAGRTPVVLVSQVKDHQEPWMLSAKVANWVLGAILRSTSKTLRYFESCQVKKMPLGIQYMSEIHFDYLGDGPRQRLYNPISFAMGWDDVESIVGCPLEP